MKKISFLLALVFLLSGCTLENKPKEVPVFSDPPNTIEQDEEIEAENTDDKIVGEQPSSSDETETSPESKQEDDTENKTSDELSSLPEILPDERDSVIIMQVGGTDVSYAAFSYYLHKAQTAFPFSSAEVWEKTALFETKCDVATELLAAQFSVEMSEEYKNEFVDQVVLNTIKTYNGVDSVSYPEALAIFNMTDLFYRQLQENSVLQTLIYNECFSPESGTGFASDENLLSYIHENYIRIKHILVSTADLDDAGKAQAKKKAEEILAFARNGEPFEELISDYSDDSMDPYVGYYITHDVTVIELEEKGFDMPIGTISDLVESPYGYHIIKKYPLDDEYVLSTGNIRASAEKDLCEKAFYDALYETATSLGVVYYDNYGSAVSELLQ